MVQRERDRDVRESKSVEVLLERVCTSVEFILTAHRELKDEINERMANVGDLEALRVNYIAADQRIQADIDKNKATVDAAISQIKADLKAEYVSRQTFKWTIGVAILLFALLALGVDMKPVVTWFGKAALP